MTQHYLTESELCRARDIVYKAIRDMTTPTATVCYYDVTNALCRITDQQVALRTDDQDRTKIKLNVYTYDGTRGLSVDVTNIKELCRFLGNRIDAQMLQLLRDVVSGGASESQILTVIHDVHRYDPYLTGCKPAAVTPAADPLALKGLITSDRVVTNIQDAITGLYHRLIVLFVLTWIVLATVGITILKYLAHIA